MKLYGKLLAEGRVKRDRNSEMYAYWSDRVAKGENPTAREVSDACKTTIHAARAAVRRYRSGIIPKQMTGGLAPKTVRNIHAMIHRALVDAVAWKYITYNPASNIKPPKRPRKRAAWCGSPDQIQAFLMSVQHDRFAALFLLELTTGIRRGQICGLKWSAVDLDAGEITVHDNRVVVGWPRAGQGRRQNRECRPDDLDRSGHRRERCAAGASVKNGEREFFGADYHPGDYVFTFEDGRPPHPDTIRQRFDRLAAAAGLSRITFHDLRHSYATGALKAGVSPKILSERIGHADVGFFLQTYAHVITNDDREAAEQAASFLIGNGWDPEPR